VVGEVEGGEGSEVKKRWGAGFFTALAASIYMATSPTRAI